ncbi:MAG: hypothetical protein U0031_15120 [Thermomicrobiales bacterium]
MAGETDSPHVEQDLAFQRREWRLQRVGWSLMLLIVIAGLLGLLGPGPLSWTNATAGPLTVNYQRFIHRSAPSEFEVLVAPEAFADDAVTVWLGGSFIERVDMEQVFPEPESMDAAADRVVYHFAVDANGGPARIEFDFQPREAGPTQLQVGVHNAALQDLNLMVFP